jgi:hypothetical protein
MNILGLNMSRASIFAMALLVPLASFSFLGLSSQGKIQMLSERELVAQWHQLEPEASRPLYYLNFLPVSARYYSNGKVLKIDSGFSDLLGHGFWLAVHKTEGDASAWNCSLQFQPRRGIFDLYLCNE